MDEASLSTKDRIITVKSSITGIGCVLKSHYLRYKIAYKIIPSILDRQYIFLNELQADPQCDLKEYINKEFFAEVWLSLVDYTKGNARAEKVIEYRNYISRHLPSYLNITNYQRFRLNMRFGQHLRQSINVLLNVKQRMAEMKQALLEQGVDPKIIEGLIFQDVTQTAKNFKMAISTRPTNMSLLPQNPQVEINAYNALRPVLDSYGTSYSFKKRSIYYDAKAQPENHFMAFVQLARLFETLGLPPFRCFSLRRSWSPGYVQIDSKILCQNILDIRWSNNIDKLNYWKQVVDLNAKHFKAQEENKLLRFRGTIQTDGVGVTVLKKRIDRQSSYTSTIKEADEKFKYISDLSAQEHKAVNGRCVAIDPGRRDLLFCVDEKYTVETPIKFRYTKQDQDKTRKSKKYYCNILQAMKSNNPAVFQAENALAENQSSSLEMEGYRRFLERLGQNYAVLDNLYGYTTTSSQNPQFMLRKLRLAAYFNKQRVDMQLINFLKQKFGKDAIFVLGNWSAPNARYHEPIRGIGLR
ncbi:uncharacterized protein EV154DRAFT_552220 [Mucor mucedo]|uniref:uncharacterized protein n=1 Tax=Mucor mucedo TaxID=29922 RepID=UPI00221FA7FA|nr:uncharacterized protein EV154DRAFT_552220 [Mucor mucedo]KAI7890503.1 hypothetical protein EV154DRAFT_552220 [Mucor mucedo]